MDTPGRLSANGRVLVQIFTPRLPRLRFCVFCAGLAGDAACGDCAADRLPDKSGKKEGQDSNLAKMIRLAPLFGLILRLLELILKNYIILNAIFNRGINRYADSLFSKGALISSASASSPNSSVLVFNLTFTF